MKTLLALFAGVVNVAAFAPFGWWPLCLLSIAALFWLWLGAGRAAAAWYGFVFGVGLFGAGTSWVYVSMHNFGGMPPALAGLCVLLLVLVVSLYPAAAGLAQSLFPRRALAIRAVLILPGVWLLFEWLRGWLFSGFPWLTTGYAMLDTPLAGFAPLGGVYLLGILTLMSAGGLLALLHGLTWRRTLLSALLGVGWAGGWQLSASGLAWTEPAGEEISVAIIQNNVPLMLKWDAAQSNRIIAGYLAQSARHRAADLVVWPEAAVPDYLDRLPPEFYEQLRDHPADFIFGVLTRMRRVADADTDTGADTGSATTDGEWQIFNSIAALVGDRPPALYHKQHLVPFGEFLPLERLFRPLLERLNIPMSNLSPWHQPQRRLQAAGASLAASICYEDAFPEEWRAQVPDSGVLVNVSEDMWFGDSLAPHQRLQMARFRALESGRPMIRASNNGLSSVINWRGGVDIIARQFVQAVVLAGVQPRTGTTPYTQFGNAPALALVVVLLAIVLFGGRRRRYNSAMLDPLLLHPPNPTNSGPPGRPFDS